MFSFFRPFSYATWQLIVFKLLLWQALLPNAHRSQLVDSTAHEPEKHAY